MPSWRWDQGHLEYFAFEKIRQLATFVSNNDFRAFSRDQLFLLTGMEFSAPATHSPWRNYARALKASLLVSEAGKTAVGTDVAIVLAENNATSDEYLHFLSRVTTEPSPAFANYDNSVEFRYPLLFSLKYLLAKSASGQDGPTKLNEILFAYSTSTLKGSEDQEVFLALIKTASGKSLKLERQPRESLLILSQISYLHTDGKYITCSLDASDALGVFEDLVALEGPFLSNRSDEIRRRASLFKGGSDMDTLSFPNTALDESVLSGFAEGGKFQRTHLVIERNRRLRQDYFLSKPTDICDICHMTTSASYPWTSRVLDLHHLVPLASGHRTGTAGTNFDDLVPVCPTCHRATHRYYDAWLNEHGQKDFVTSDQARATYTAMRAAFKGHTYASA